MKTAAVCAGIGLVLLGIFVTTREVFLAVPPVLVCTFGCGAALGALRTNGAGAALFALANLLIGGVAVVGAFLVLVEVAS